MTTNNLQPFRKTKLILILSILGFLAALGGYVYVFHMVAVAGADTASLQVETSALEVKESKIGELKKTLASIQAEEPVLNSYFIDANDIVPFLETIEDYGRKTNVTVKFNSVDIKQSPAALSVLLVSKGTFTDLYHFISLVEAAPYQFTVTSANLQLGTSDTIIDPKGVPPVLWDANISLSVTSITGVTPAPEKK